MKYSSYFILLLSFLLFSCSKSDEMTKSSSGFQSGVVLTFDDDYADDWIAVDAVLRPYDWKATFFVTRFNQLSPSKIKELQELKSYGHEIGGHGLNHLKATTFIGANGAEAYLHAEINPMMSAMAAENLSTTSFAYPFGARNLTTDAVLLSKFKIIRGTTYGAVSPALQDCFYNNSSLVLGLGLDKSYPQFSNSYFISLLNYAKNNNKIVVFYAHKPVVTSHNDYETEYETLLQICKFVKQNHMKFYTFSELRTVPNV